jgi:hypothetical protein
VRAGGRQAPAAAAGEDWRSGRRRRRAGQGEQLAGRRHRLSSPSRSLGGEGEGEPRSGSDDPAEVGWWSDVSSARALVTFLYAGRKYKGGQPIKAHETYYYSVFFVVFLLLFQG